MSRTPTSGRMIDIPWIFSLLGLVACYESIFKRRLVADPPTSTVSTSSVPKLALTVEQGYGYFPARPGLTLKDGRYEVSRMLGISQLSSVFLVRDLGADGYTLHSGH